MLYKEFGTWKPKRAGWVKHNGVWVSPKEEWIKVEGVWKQLIPAHCIVLYYNASHYDGYGVLANGSNGTPNLCDNRYVLGVGTSHAGAMGTGGSESHSGTSHGSESSGTSTYYAVDIFGFDTWGSPKRGYNGNPGHSHSIPSHTHTGTGSHRRNEIRYMPVMYSDYLVSGARLVSTTNASSVMGIVSTQNRFLVLSSTYSTPNYSSSHNHGTKYMDTTTSGSAYDQYTYTSATDYRSATPGHNHSADHTMNTVTTTPYYRGLYLRSANSKIYFNDIPSGTLIMSVADIEPPDGWSYYDGLGGRTVYLGNEGVLGGNSTHTHPPKTCTTGHAPFTSYKDCKRQSDVESTMQGHTHTWTDYHPTTVNHMPPYRMFLFYIKD